MEIYKVFENVLDVTHTCLVYFCHVRKKEVDHPIVVVQQGIVKGQLPLLALVLDLFDVALVQSLEILQDESHFLKILLEQ